MKSKRGSVLPFLVGLVFVLGCVLLAGCADLLQGPPGAQDSAGDGRVVITVGSGAERTIGPRMDQFSKIVLSFERKNGSGTMSPVATVYTHLGDILIKNKVRYTQSREEKVMGIINFENCFNDQRLGKRGRQFWIF